MVNRLLPIVLVAAWIGDAQAQRRERPDPAVTYSIPVAGSPTRGARDALVTLVVASEFDCPYCNKLRPTLEQLLQDYGKDLRIVYKHFVVHPATATDAARAACAAHKQGKFWEMSEQIWDKGYLAGRKLDAQHIESLAGELGLDMQRFRSDLHGAPCRAVVVADQAMMKKVGTSGVPSSYVNGRHLSGAQPIERFRQLIDEELAKARKRIGKSRRRARRYYRDWVVRRGVKQTPIAAGGTGGPPALPAVPRPAAPDPSVTYAIPVGNAPIRGPRHAKITMVVACQFTGPYCERIRPTFDALLAKYGKDLRLIFKHYPVHAQRATIPALAACAAHRQGKYFEMDELLWSSVKHDGDWSRERMRSEAEALGLDLDRFDADMDGHCKTAIAADQAEMRRFGVTGTPATFVNGRFIRGAQPVDVFERLINEELVKANRRIKRRRDIRRYYDKWVLGRGQKRLTPRAEAGP